MNKKIYYILLVMLPFVFITSASATDLNATTCSNFNAIWDSTNNTCTVNNVVTISGQFNIPTGTTLIVTSKSGYIQAGNGQPTVINNSGTIIVSDNAKIATWYYSLINNSGTGIIYNYANILNLDSINNDGYILNTGVIQDGSGVINNNKDGVINNTGTITLFNYGGTINNDGNFTNSGGIDNNNIVNSGIFNNRGSIGTPISNSGSFTNDGTISIGNGNSIINSGTFTNNIDGIINNTGNISNSGTFDNNGVINILCGGTVTGAFLGNPIKYICQLSGNGTVLSNVWYPKQPRDTISIPTGAAISLVAPGQIQISKNKFMLTGTDGIPSVNIYSRTATFNITFSDGSQYIATATGSVTSTYNAWNWTSLVLQPQQNQGYSLNLGMQGTLTWNNIY